MSSNCSFVKVHEFNTVDIAYFSMLTLFKSLVMTRFDYLLQLLETPHLVNHKNMIEKMPRSFTKHIAGMHE